MKSIAEITLVVCCALYLETGAAAAQAAQCPTALFATELEAVIAAADNYNPLSIREDREYVGAIFEEDGKFGFTVSANARRKDSWRLGIARVDWDRIRAFWHTHGDASPQHRYFSRSDTETVERLGLPFYLADYTGYLKIFRRGDRTLNPFAARRLNLPRQPGYAVGEYVRDATRRPVRVRVREGYRS